MWTWTPGDGEREAAVVQNLRDAGCPEELIDAFLAKINAGRTAEGLRLLASHRRDLLDALHRDAKKIDCLDYLVYQMKKGK